MDVTQLVELGSDTSRNGRDTVQVLLHRWWILLLVAAIGGGAAAGISSALPVRYSASTTIVVQMAGNTANTETPMTTVQALVTSDVFAADLAKRSDPPLSVDAVEDRLQIARPPGSAVLQVSAIDSSRASAESLARGVLPILRARLGEMRDSAGKGLKLRVAPFGGPAPLVRTVTPPVARNGVVGASAGGLLGAIVALLVPYPSRRESNGTTDLHAHHPAGRDALDVTEFARVPAERGDPAQQTSNSTHEHQGR